MSHFTKHSLCEQNWAENAKFLLVEAVRVDHGIEQQPYSLQTTSRALLRNEQT